MKNYKALMRNHLYLLISLLFFASCSNRTDTPVHKVYTVEIKQMQFQPAELTVQKGDTIIWINRDIVQHDVTEEKSKAWTSSPLLTGQSWTLVATENADYYCSIHQVMKGKLLVQ